MINKLLTSSFVFLLIFNSAFSQTAEEKYELLFNAMGTGDYNSVQRYERDVLNHWRSTYKGYKQDTLYIQVLGFLSTTHHSFGNYERALELGYEMLPLAKAKYGEDHIFYVTNNAYIGGLEIKIGRYEQGAERISETIDLVKFYYGENSNQYINQLGDLGTANFQLKRDKYALELLTQALQLIESKPLDIRHGDYNLFLGFIFDSRREYEMSIIHFKKANETYQVLGYKNKVVTTYESIYYSYNSLSDTASSIFNLESIIRYCSDNGLEDDYRMYDAKRRLGNIQANREQYDNAIKNFNEAINGYEKMDPKYRSSIYYVYSSLAKCYLFLGDYPLVLETNQKKNDFAQSYFGATSYEYYSSLLSLATDHIRLHDYSNAFKNLKKSNKELKSLVNFEELYISSLTKTGQYYLNFGDLSKAKEHLNYALDIMDKADSLYYFDRSNCYLYLSQISDLEGDFSAALAYNNLHLKSIEQYYGGKENLDYLVFKLSNIRFKKELIGLEASIEEAKEIQSLAEKIYGYNSSEFIEYSSFLLTQYSSNWSKYGKEVTELSKELIKISDRINANKEMILKFIQGIVAAGVAGNDYKTSLEKLNLLEELTLNVYGGNSKEYLSLFMWQTRIYDELGMVLKARESLDKAFEIFNHKLPDSLKTDQLHFDLINWSGIISGNQGLNHIALWESKLALGLVSDVKRLKVDVAYQQSHLTALNNVANRYVAVGEIDSCIMTLNHLLKLADQENWPLSTTARIKVFSNLSYAYTKVQRLDSAHYYTSKTYELARESYDHSSRDYQEITDNLAMVNQNIGNYQASDSLYIQSIKLTQTIIEKNQSGLSEMEKIFFKNTYLMNKIYSLIDYGMIRHHDNPHLLKHFYDYYAVNNGKLTNESASLNDLAEETKNPELIELIERKKVLTKRLVSISRLSESEKKNIQFDINEIERRLSHYSDSLSKESNYTSNSISSLLNKKEVFVDLISFIHYSHNDTLEPYRTYDKKRIYAALISYPDSSHFNLKILGEGDKIDREIYPYYASLIHGENRDLDQKDTIFYHYFYRPLEEDLADFDRIHIVPFGSFHDINFATLYNSATKHFLVHDKEIIVQPSARHFIQNRSTDNKSQNKIEKVVLIGDPNFGTSELTTSKNSERSLQSGNFLVEPLPGTKSEIDNISYFFTKKKINVTEFSGSMANESNVYTIQQPDVLHISTHGFAWDEIPKYSKDSSDVKDLQLSRLLNDPLMRTGLLLSGANEALKNGELFGDNGILTARELSLIDLTGTKLVVLSACETGTGAISIGEGVEGLRRAVFDAGARNIIASLWKVDDNVTQEFMTTFYSTWLSGKTIREAFNETQLIIKDKYLQPYYWGAFVLVGE